MELENVKRTETAHSTMQLNEYLKRGWVLLMAYVEPDGENSQAGWPRFTVGWVRNTPPVFPKKEVGYIVETDYEEPTTIDDNSSVS